MDISTWIDTFTVCWINHNVDGVLALFTDDVKYWETPYRLVGSYEELRKEWEGIKNQEHISITTKIVFSSSTSHAITWNLAYLDQNNQKSEWAGTYLISLNAEGKCSYFHHTGEKRSEEL